MNFKVLPLGFFQFWIFIVLITWGVEAVHVVLVSIKLLRSLVSEVMVGVEKPRLLLVGNSSSQIYSLCPSEVSMLQ